MRIVGPLMSSIPEISDVLAKGPRAPNVRYVPARRVVVVNPTPPMATPPPPPIYYAVVDAVLARDPGMT
jgi:hypothetical protein